MTVPGWCVPSSSYHRRRTHHMCNWLDRMDRVVTDFNITISNVMVAACTSAPNELCLQCIQLQPVATHPPPHVIDTLWHVGLKQADISQLTVDCKSGTLPHNHLKFSHPSLFNEGWENCVVCLRIVCSCLYILSDILQFNIINIIFVTTVSFYFYYTAHLAAALCIVISPVCGFVCLWVGLLPW